MRRTRYPSRNSDRNGFLFFAVGTLSGVAAGVYLARRYRNGGELVDAVRAKLGAFREFWNAEDELEDELEDEFDDELAGERERLLVNAYEDDMLDDDEPAALPSGADAGLSDDPLVTGEFLETPAPMERSPERDLEARVLAVFVEDDLLRDRAVDIAAVGTGVIELSGWVHTGDESARATALARQTPGVSMVLNRVSIRSATADDKPMSAPETSRAINDVRTVTPEGPTT